jgi:hypothetical protein
MLDAKLEIFPCCTQCGLGARQSRFAFARADDAGVGFAGKPLVLDGNG